MPSKVLITGAEGQLGRVLQHRLGNIFNLIPTAKSPGNMAMKKRNVRAMDITNFSSIDSCIKIENPDIVINCAAMTNVDACEKDHTLAYAINVAGIQNIIKATNKRVKIIQISTDYVFEGNNGPYSETDSTHPLSYYGRSQPPA
jgi:dTDP-4-dehydrorhamnose reductase